MKSFTNVITFSVLVLFAQYGFAEQACIYNKGVFTTSSGTEFKGPGAKNKCLNLEREELVKKNCVSNNGTVIGLGDPRVDVKVECDPVGSDDND